MVARGEVCWLELAEEGRRPVVVLTRNEAIPSLRNVTVALVTRTVRDLPSEVQLGPADGMPVECAVTLDNLRTVPRALLVESITHLDETKMRQPDRLHTNNCVIHNLEQQDPLRYSDRSIGICQSAPWIARTTTGSSM